MNLVSHKSIRNPGNGNAVDQMSFLMTDLVGSIDGISGNALGPYPRPAIRGKYRSGLTSPQPLLQKESGPETRELSPGFSIFIGIKT
jgi:hypothetical protein